MVEEGGRGEGVDKKEIESEEENENAVPKTLTGIFFSSHISFEYHTHVSQGMRPYVGLSVALQKERETDIQTDKG